jgi:hypothetical protein
MRKKKREIGNPAEVEAILEAGHVLHLAMCVDGEPYVVPLNYGYANGAIWLHGATEGKRIDMIRANGRVAFNVIGYEELKRADDPCKYGAYYESVSGTGRAVIVEDEEEKRAGLEALMSHYEDGPFEFPDDIVAITGLVRIDIETLTGKRLLPKEGT